MHFIAFALALLAGTDQPATPRPLTPLEESIKSVFAPFVAGRIVSFECPSDTSGSFECRGGLDDGGTFTVASVTGPDVVRVNSIRYAADPPSAIVLGVQSQLPGVQLTVVDCPLSGGPASIVCQAIHADGQSTPVYAGIQPDGSVLVYGTITHLSDDQKKLLRIAGIAVLAGGILLLALSLVQMYRLRQRNIVIRLPLIPQQPVSFDTPDTYVLYGETGRFSFAFMGLKYSLVHEPTGEEVRSFPAILRARSAGWSRVRQAVRRFFIQHSGQYILRIDGIRGDPSTATVLFSRAWTARHYIWLVLAIGSGPLDVVGLILFVAGEP